MSGTDRDKRGRAHSGKRCPEAQNGGCIYCLTGEYKRPERRRDRHDAKRALAVSARNAEEPNP